MIEINQVSKIFKTKKATVHALDEVSLKVNKGEIYGVIGYSGAGKSTLIRCINMLERPSSGELIVNGIKMTGLSPSKLREARQSIGMIFQGFNLLKTATVYENIAIPLKLTGIPSKEIDDRVKKYLKIVGLEERTEAYPAQLSGGQKQRVAIARALSHEPDVLLSDEATSALDPETTEAILDLLLQINKDFGITILLITHEMQVVQKICDRVAVMENGKVVEEGKVIDIFSNSKTKTTEKFINSLFPEDVPTDLMEELNESGPIIRLSFIGHSTGRPALSEATKKFDVYANILSGNIVQLKNEPYGRLVVHLQGSKEETEKAVQYLIDAGVKVERVDVTNESVNGVV